MANLKDKESSKSDDVQAVSNGTEDKVKIFKKSKRAKKKRAKIKKASKVKAKKDKKAKKQKRNENRETVRVSLPVELNELMLDYCEKANISVSRVGRQATSKFLDAIRLYCHLNNLQFDDIGIDEFKDFLAVLDRGELDLSLLHEIDNADREPVEKQELIPATQDEIPATPIQQVVPPIQVADSKPAQPESPVYIPPTPIQEFTINEGVYTVIDESPEASAEPVVVAPTKTPEINNDIVIPHNVIITNDDSSLHEKPSSPPEKIPSNPIIRTRPQPFDSGIDDDDDKPHYDPPIQTA